MKLKLIVLLTGAFFCLLGGKHAEAADGRGLIIHAAEIGIGKFHRQDNDLRPYAHDNIWLNYVLPKGPAKTPTVRDNDDGSVTIFFSTLEELLREAIKVSVKKNARIDVMNINAHGMPGAMWFPKDQATMNGSGCKQWVESAKGEDQANFKQYYSPVSRFDIYQFRLLSKLPSIQWMAPCTTGFNQWKEVVDRNPQIKTAFADDAQLHMFSCIVGLGRAGQNFTTSLATLLFSGDGARVETSMNFGLGDWSMPEGMGFWDYQNSSQLERDNSRYPVDKKDRDMMQKGQIRLASLSGKSLKTGIIPDLDFMLGTKDTLKTKDIALFEPMEESMSDEDYARLQIEGMDVTIPGTNTTVHVLVK